MFKDAATNLVAYTNAEQNWPRYALVLHAIEPALKAFAKQCEMQGANLGNLPHNHDLQAWHDLAVQHGLENNQRIAQNIPYLTDLHFTHFSRYPQNRSTPVPDLSIIADETVEYLIETITQSVNPR